MANQTKKRQQLNRLVAEEIAIACTARKNNYNSSDSNQWDREDIRAYIIFISGVDQYQAFWLRDINDWEMPISYHTQTLIKSLVNHLFVLYEMPAVMYKAWWNNTLAYKRWFIHIGQGKNLRSVEDMPIRLSKKMVHLLSEVPEYLSIPSALRWIQIKALGGNEELINKILTTRLSHHLKNDAFWLTVIQFFINNSKLSVFYMQSIVDYIFEQRFTSRRTFDKQCRWIKLPPHQADFKMKGRSAKGMKKLIQNWCQKKKRLKNNATWRRQEIEGIRFETGEGIHYRLYTIRQITDEARLRKEGTRMKHCVYTYLDQCKKGISSIWSMEEVSPLGNHRLTIEVWEGKWVDQIRGRCNQWPTKEQIAFVRFWANCEGLTMDACFDD